METLSPQTFSHNTFFSNIQAPKQGGSRGLARLGPLLGASWDHPQFSLKVKKVKSALWVGATIPVWNPAMFKPEAQHILSIAPGPESHLKKQIFRAELVPFGEPCCALGLLTRREILLNFTNCVPKNPPAARPSVQKWLPGVPRLPRCPAGASWRGAVQRTTPKL